MLVKYSALVLVLAGLSVAAPATAEVIYQQRSRAQMAAVQSCDLLCLSQGGAPTPSLPTPDVNTSDFAQYTNTIIWGGAARSALSYSLSDDSISVDASAMAAAASMNGRTDVYSAFSVTFGLTEATAFTFTGTGTWGVFGRGAMDLSLTGEDVSITRTIERTGGCCRPADMFSMFETGVLAPGIYTLNASVLNAVHVEPSTTASLTGQLTFLPAPVPLPTTLWLLASGLAGVVARTRRSTRYASD